MIPVKNISTTMPENTEALLYQLQAESGKMNDEELKTRHTQVRALTGQALFQQGRLIDFLRRAFQGSQTSEQKLKNRLEKLSFKHVITLLEGKTRQTLSRMQTISEAGQREVESVLKILDAIDTGKADKAKQEIDKPVLGSSNSDTTIYQAQKQNIQSANDAETIRNLDQRTKQSKVAQTFQKQKSAIGKQLDELKKMSFFSKLFQVFSVIVTVVVSALTAGAGTAVAGALKIASQALFKAVSTLVNKAIQEALRLALEGLQVLGTLPFKKSIEENQLKENSEARYLSKVLNGFDQREVGAKAEQQQANKMKVRLKNVIDNQ